ncbi:antA/AntB antirepressor family protein [Chitinivorax sp. B]|uniref:antA/AntB antirepressor family protein n=1 Tax=Chitinivorax sp. B TaxID=2502235 RepID=UPI0010F7B6AE|nr:antA/AntB antirepressor family protein [Chitinivorax sp. B]
MNELIPVYTVNSIKHGGLLVDARLLHAQLQVQTRFGSWIHQRIDEYGFFEGEDYYLDACVNDKQVTANLGNAPGLRKGGRPITKYHLTLRMAIELSLVERTDIGRKIRRYFIEQERTIRQIQPPFLLGERTQQGTLRATDIRLIAKLAEQTAVKLAKAATPGEWQQHFDALTSYNTLLNQPAPLSIRFPCPPDLAAVYRREFWELVDDVELAKVNHSANRAEIAVSLPYLSQLARQYGLGWPELDKAKTRDAIETALRYDPRYLRSGRIQSRLHHGQAPLLRCLIFSASA